MDKIEKNPRSKMNVFERALENEIEKLILNSRLKVSSFKFIHVVDSVKLKCFLEIFDRYGNYWLNNILKQII